MFKLPARIITILSTYQRYRNISITSQLLKGIGIMKVGTHDGVFHCDEVLACYMLKLLPEYSDAEIVRTRDLEKLKTCDIVVDVGAEFDHERKRYDHHQREFKETLSTIKPDLGNKYKIKLSSAGLIYAFYGENIIQSLAPKECPLHPDNLQIIFKKVYEHFIEEMDAIDNGVPMTDEEEPKYKIRTHLSARVGKLNPEWNTMQTTNVDELFEKAMKMVSEEFLHVVNYFISVWLPARDFVKTALETRFEVHKSGKILEFKERFPWKEHLFDLEEEMGLIGEVNYVVFNDKPNSWRVQAIPVAPVSFVTRKPLHEKWWGVRDDLLSDIAGIKDCVFCHSTGFIGGNCTREGAIAMAEASLNA
ncbi:MYG1 exonuclease [Pieris napi]|uniref:MYG1 exonuclease n=1 Tax=Pieris napi TaxID=78633 RepID=UPI001FB897CD|nr:MYG1 exonuclease [Pieris napi]